MLDNIGFAVHANFEDGVMCGISGGEQNHTKEATWVL